MLSAETATGEYPVEAVQMMSRVITATEKELPPADSSIFERTVRQKIPQAIADAVSYTQERGTASVIFAFTTSGFTAQLISNLFSSFPIIALTPSRRVMSMLSLYRSVYPVRIEQPRSFTELFDIVRRAGRESGAVRPGDNVLVTGGAPFGQTVPTNFMLIMNFEENKESGS
jgi:pyruvate kinase